MNQPHVDEIIERYLVRLSKHGRSEAALGWRFDTAKHRYLAVARAIENFGPIHVLDIGTGFGGLLSSLRSADWKGRFTGIDLVEDFIYIAKELHNSDYMSEFHKVCDLFEFRNYTCDFGVALGVLNHASTSNSEFRTTFLDTLIRSVRMGFAMDFLCDDSNRKADDLFYQDIKFLASWAAQRKLKWKIDHSYLRFEYLFVVLKDESSSEDFLY